MEQNGDKLKKPFGEPNMIQQTREVFDLIETDNQTSRGFV